MADVHLLVVNPNSSQSVTDGLQASLSLGPSAPPGMRFSFFTAPPSAPQTITNAITANQTATICYQALVDSGVLGEYDGVLVACFSDHPLTHMLREHLMSVHSSKPVINIFEAAVSHAMLLGRRFGIITTGQGMKNPLVDATVSFLGGNSQRFVGVWTTGLGVVELREGDRHKIEMVMKSTSANGAAAGADVLILGCAGMTGMEKVVKTGVREAGLGEVRVVDGAKAGVQLLAGLART